VESVETVVVSGVYQETAVVLSPGNEGVFYPEISPVKYLEGIEMGIIKRIEGIAKGGTLEDAVKLRANQALWGKIGGDRTVKSDSGDLEESPYEAILRRLERKDKEE